MSDAFWTFATTNPITALLIVFTAAFVVTAPFRYGYAAYKYTLRARNIFVHGWPTPPIDADGDVIYPENDDDARA